MADGLPTIRGSAVTSPAQTGNLTAGIEEQASTFGKIARSASAIGDVLRARQVERAKKDALKDFNRQEDLDQFAEDIGAENPHKATKRSTFLGLQTVGDHAYNNMLETLYMQRTQTDIEQKAEELRKKHFGDVAGYDKEMLAYRKGLMKSVDPEFADEIDYTINRTDQKFRHDVAMDRQAADMSEAKSSMEARLQATGERVSAAVRQYGIAALDNPAVAKDLKDLQKQMQIKADNPLYEYSDDELMLDADHLATNIEATALMPEVERVYREKGYAEALKAADAMASSLNRDASTQNKIQNLLRGEVNQVHSIRAAERAEEEDRLRAAKAEREAIGEELDKSAMSIINSSGYSMKDKRAAVEAARPYVSASRYGTLLNAMTEGSGDGVSDGTFGMLQVLAGKNQIDYAEIVNMGGLSDSQRKFLITELQSADNSTRKRALEMVDAAYEYNDSYITNESEIQRREVKKIEARRAFDDWQNSLGHTPSSREADEFVTQYLSTDGRTDALAAKSRRLKPGTPTPESIAEARKQVEDQVAKLYKGTPFMISPDDRVQLDLLADEGLLLDEIERSLDNAN